MQLPAGSLRALKPGRRGSVRQPRRAEGAVPERRSCTAAPGDPFQLVVDHLVAVASCIPAPFKMTQHRIGPVVVPVTVTAGKPRQCTLTSKRWTRGDSGGGLRHSQACRARLGHPRRACDGKDMWALVGVPRFFMSRLYPWGVR